MAEEKYANINNIMHIEPFEDPSSNFRAKYVRTADPPKPRPTGGREGTLAHI